MKKFFFVVAIGAFAACNNSSSTESKVDSPKLDSPVVKVDSPVIKSDSPLVVKDSPVVKKDTPVKK